jgi:hypothetical protein
MILEGIPNAAVGIVRDDDRLIIAAADQSAPVIDASIGELKKSWQQTLKS